MTTTEDLILKAVEEIRNSVKSLETVVASTREETIKIATENSIKIEKLEARAEHDRNNAKQASKGMLALREDILDKIDASIQQAIKPLSEDIQNAHNKIANIKDGFTNLKCKQDTLDKNQELWKTELKYADENYKKKTEAMEKHINDIFQLNETLKKNQFKIFLGLGGIAIAVVSSNEFLLEIIALIAKSL